MSGDGPVNNLAKSATCLCCMCKCGDHKCPEQHRNTLPAPLRDLGTLKIEKLRNAQAKKEHICQAFELLPGSKLYTNTTYKEHFEAKPKIIDSSPQKLVGNLKCLSGAMEKGTTYSREFLPWLPENIKQNGPILNSFHQASGDSSRVPTKSKLVSNLNPRVIENLRKYYCPRHCVGTKKSDERENCLIPHKDKFNLGPPSKKERNLIKRPQQPFAKYTNYALDYVPHKFEPRKIIQKKTIDSDVGQPSLPAYYGTTYDKDFPWPPGEGGGPQKRNDSTSKKDLDQKSTLKLGDGGPMVTQSSNMLDYKDPKVTLRPSKTVFHAPTCRMETETTTGASYRGWNVLPSQSKSRPLNESHYAPCNRKDDRSLLTTYQEDFDGLCRALCPAKSIENYGRKILEPKYHFIGSKNGHDCYQREKLVLTDNK